MKRILLIAALLLCIRANAQFSWSDYIGKSRDSLRSIERNNGDKLIKSGISDKGYQYEVYSPFTEEDSWHSSEAFYYDINYICLKVRVILARDYAPDFIEKTLNINFHRIDNTTWVSKDAKYVVSLIINSGDNYVAFEYLKREDFIK